jgi:nucleoside-diphosphate-sugar epimerase
MGTWQGGREKVPAALCRKVASAKDGTGIDIWGDGEQTRSFLFIEDCLEATVRMMRGDWVGPVNIGSTELVSINELAGMIIEISGKKLTLKHIEGPLGVRGRNSDNTLIKKKLGWTHSVPLHTGF